MPDMSQALSAPTSGSQLNSVLLHGVVLKGNPDVQATNMDGETVLLDLSTGRYYTLNQLGSLIWELCTGQHTIGDIHTILCSRFDVVPDRALGDLVSLIDQLIKEGLLQQERR